MDKNKILKICVVMLSVILLLVGLIIFSVLNNGSGSVKWFHNNKIESIDLVTNFEKDMFIVNDVNEYTSIITKQKMKRIGFTINNNTDNDINMNMYMFHLTDKNKNELGLCYTSDSEYETDSFPSLAASNTTTEAHIYCSIIGDNPEVYLKVTYATKGYKDENGKYSIDTNDVFLELK